MVAQTAIRLGASDVSKTLGSPPKFKGEPRILWHFPKAVNCRLTKKLREFPGGKPGNG